MLSGRILSVFIQLVTFHFSQSR